MKPYCAILLILILAAPFVYKSIIVGKYFLNLDYYANVLCENKNLPEKKCNGLCRLTKELSTDDDASRQSAPSLFKEIEISSFVLPSHVIFYAIFSNIIEIKTYLFSEHIRLGFPSRMIKPPCS
jgi:hypothetical protein